MWADCFHMGKKKKKKKKEIKHGEEGEERRRFMLMLHSCHMGRKIYWSGLIWLEKNYWSKMGKQYEIIF